MKQNLLAKEKREKRVRKKIKFQSTRLRLTVFRSNRYIYAQIIDDAKGTTLVSARQHDVKQDTLKKTELAFALGKLLADKAKKKKIANIVFDRGSFAYHGRVKAVADGAREGGLRF